MSVYDIIYETKAAVNCVCLFCSNWFKMFKLYLFYNDYGTSSTTYINHARWHRCLRLGGPRVGVTGVTGVTGVNPPV